MKPHEAVQPNLWSVALIALALGTAAHGAAMGRQQERDRVGTIQDLSGPLAGFGKQVRLGMMRVDESTSRAASTAARSSC